MSHDGGHVCIGRRGEQFIDKRHLRKGQRGFDDKTT